MNKLLCIYDAQNRSTSTNSLSRKTEKIFGQAISMLKYIVLVGKAKNISRMTALTEKTWLERAIQSTEIGGHGCE